MRLLAREFEGVKKHTLIPHQQLLLELENSDCLIVPSRVDPIPTVAVEMLMKEGICLCTDVCGVAHYMRDGENAFTVPVENPAALAEKIMKVIDMVGESEDLCGEGRRIYEEHFSEEVIQRQILRILREFGM